APHTDHGLVRVALCDSRGRHRLWASAWQARNGNVIRDCRSGSRHRLRADRATLTRFAEVLGPIDHVAAAPVDGECDAHLAESGGHDVGAVMRTRQPARDRLLRRSDTACNVLAHHAPAIAGVGYAQSRGAAIAARMAEEVVRRHVL